MHRDPLEAVIAANLKIVLLSRNRDTAQTFRSFFHINGQAAPQRIVEGGVEQARLIAEKDRPDVLVIEGARHDESELLVIEPLVLRDPGMSVIVLSNNQSAEYLRLGMRIGLREILPLPLSMETLLRTVSRYHERASAAGRPAGSRIYCFIGSKGGSGTTFLATNLGYALASQGKKTALFDLNLHSGDAAVYVSDRTPKFTLADVTRAVDRLDGTLLASSMLHVMPNFHVLPAPEDADHALHVRGEDLDAVLAIAAANYDAIVVDGGRAVNALTVRAMDRADTVYVILQQSVPFMRDAQRLLRILSGLGYGKDKVKLIVNRFDKKGVVGADEIAASLKHEVHRLIPNSFSAVAESIDQGVPIIKLTARDPVARTLNDMAGVLAGTRKNSSGWLKGLLSPR
jgi:pilus assembly protein CpaE